MSEWRVEAKAAIQTDSYGNRVKAIVKEALRGESG